MPEPESEENPQVDPEQLLKRLEADLAMQRAHRLSGQAKQFGFRVYALLVILVGAMLALFGLYYVLQQLPRPGQAGSGEVQKTEHPAR